MAGRAVPDLFLSMINQGLGLSSLSNDTSSGRALFDSCKGGYGYGGQCCPLVVDPLSWLALLAGIAVATFLLQQAIVANIGKRKRRRRDVMGGKRRLIVL